MSSLRGKTLFITGASRGIGLAIAKRAAADGANIVLIAKTTEPNPKLPGTIYRDRKGNRSWDTTYSAYVGGPLIQDRLYMFVSAEAEKQQGTSTATSAAGARCA